MLRDASALLLHHICLQHIVLLMSDDDAAERMFAAQRGEERVALPARLRLKIVRRAVLRIQAVQGDGITAAVFLAQPLIPHGAFPLMIIHMCDMQTHSAAAAEIEHGHRVCAAAHRGQPGSLFELIHFFHGCIIVQQECLGNPVARQ